MATLFELAKMSDAVYVDKGPVPSDLAMAGWVKLEDSVVDRDHYYGAAYKNTKTGEIVIANRSIWGQRRNIFPTI